MMRRLISVVLTGALVSFLAAGAVAQAQEPEEEFVAVNLDAVAAGIPPSVAVTAAVAADACGVDVGSLTQAEAAACLAETKTSDLVAAIVAALAATGQTTQTDLVNVDLQNLLLALPDSVLLPAGSVTDACGTNQPTLAPTGGNACDAQNIPPVLADAIAQALLTQ